MRVIHIPYIAALLLAFFFTSNVAASTGVASTYETADVSHDGNVANETALEPDNDLVDSRQVAEAAEVAEVVSGLSGRERLHATLRAWLAAEFGDQFNYSFATDDRRLAIPDCDQFVVGTSRTFTTAPLSLAIRARCPEADWSRLISARRPQEGPPPPAKVVKKPATPKPPPPIKKTLVLAANGLIRKGDLVGEQNLQKRWVREQRAPRDFLVAKDIENRVYALRNLPAGAIVTQRDIVAPQQVVVVAAAVPARSPIDVTTLSVVERAVDIPKDVVTSLRGLQLMAASRLLHPGDMLRRRDLMKAKLVKRGQRVSVTSGGSNFAIVSELTASEDGYLGEQIRLYNPETDRKVSAIVTGMGKARTLITPTTQ